MNLLSWSSAGYHFVDCIEYVLRCSPFFRPQGLHVSQQVFLKKDNDVIPRKARLPASPGESRGSQGRGAFTLADEKGVWGGATGRMRMKRRGRVVQLWVVCLMKATRQVCNVKKGVAVTRAAAVEQKGRQWSKRKSGGLDGRANRSERNGRNGIWGKGRNEIRRKG